MDTASLINYTLRIADNALILGHRLSEWCGHAPVLEQDIALANIALDQLGQARSLLQYAATLEGNGATEDTLAFFRNANQFRNALLVEQPNTDFAFTIVRQFFFDSYNYHFYTQLKSSADKMLAAIAEKSLKETRYHFDHASQWMLRFGDGTTESHTRAQTALNQLLPYCNEWFGDDETDEAAAESGLGLLNANLKTQWLSLVEPVITQATLALPKTTAFESSGKRGYHTEALSKLLADMQSVARQHPGAQW